MTMDTPPPWYKQFWPWFVIALPAASVIAGIATVIIASHEADSLVVDDYYKSGLAINQVIARDQQAEKLGLSAHIVFNRERQQVQLVLSSQQTVAYDTLTLQLLHPTKSNQDVSIALQQTQASTYQGKTGELSSGSWHILLEPEDKDWRLTGRLALPRETATRLQPATVQHR